MSKQTVTKQVRWQDLRVRNDIDLVWNLAHEQGWEDCEIFGYGNMITNTQEEMGWELIPADLYKYSIPAEGLRRVHTLVNQGVRIHGIIIADDQHKNEISQKGTQSKESSTTKREIFPYWGKAIPALIFSAVIVSLFSLSFTTILFLTPLITLILLLGSALNLEFDPKLIVILEDDNKDKVWVSLFTWYD